MHIDAAQKSDDDGASVQRSGLPPTRSASDVEPERQLMMAVLEDAVYCIRAHCDATDRHQRDLFLADERWMFSGDRSSFFSFENICETLGLDPHHVRQATLR